jgi:hypothetical protein
MHIKKLDNNKVGENMNLEPIVGGGGGGVSPPPPLHLFEIIKKTIISISFDSFMEKESIVVIRLGFLAFNIRGL